MKFFKISIGYTNRSKLVVYSAIARECDDLIELMHQTMAETKTKIETIRKHETKENGLDPKVHYLVSS